VLDNLLFMQKLIYDGNDRGNYCYGTFEQFMKSNQAEHIRSRFNMSSNLFQLWFLKGVVVHYKCNGSEANVKASVSLHGTSKEAIGEVERIILDAKEL